MIKSRKSHIADAIGKAACLAGLNVVSILREVCRLIHVIKIPRRSRATRLRAVYTTMSIELIPRLPGFRNLLSVLRWFESYQTNLEDFGRESD